MKYLAYAAAASLTTMVALCGCATTYRPVTRRMSPAAAAAPSAALVGRRTSVGKDHLLEMGDMLRQQGRPRKAAEVYGWVLQADPGNAAARSRLRQLPPAVAARYLKPGVPLRTAQARPRGKTPPAPPILVPVPPHNTKPPLAPVADPEDLPPPVPSAPAGPEEDSPPQKAPAAVHKPLGKLQRVRSRRAVTRVVEPPDGQPNFTAPRSDPDDHTILILPATKGRHSQKRAFQYSKRPVRNPATTFSDSPPLTIQPVSRSLPVQTATNSVLLELNRCAETPAAHVTQVAGRLAHDSSRVRAMAAYVLGRAGTSAEGQGPKLYAALQREPVAATRVRMAEALLRIEPGNGSGLRTLEEALASTSLPMRWEAVCVADTVAGQPRREEVLQELIGRLGDEDADVRAMAALKLGEFTSDVAIVVRELQTVIGRPDVDARLRRAAEASLAVLRKAKKPAAEEYSQSANKH